MSEVVVATGVVLASLGVVLFFAGLFYLPPKVSVRFEHRWGGLGSSQGGWELVFTDASALASLLFGVMLTLSGVGLLWTQQGKADAAEPPQAAVEPPVEEEPQPLSEEESG